MKGFVLAFTPAASFVFGVASDILGIPLDECLRGGGLVNLLSSAADKEGPYGNSKKNAINIQAGYTLADYYMVPKVQAAVG